MKHNNLIAEKLGTTYEIGETIQEIQGEIMPNKTVLVVPEKKEIVVVESQNEEKDQIKDYNVSRKTFNDLITKGNEAVDYLFEMAKQSEHPRAFEALSALIKTVSDVTKDLYDLQKKTKELSAISKEKEPQTINQIDKAVFVGTTSDLLNQIKNNKNN